MSQSVTERTIAALWYGFGMLDAGRAASGDAEAFAEHYASLMTDQYGQPASFIPSIQDAWRTWLAAQAPIVTTRIRIV